MKYFTTEETRKCLNGKQVIVGGNSVSRHFFIRLLSMLEGEVNDNTTQSFRHEEKKKTFKLWD